MDIETRSIDTVRPYERNPRQNDEAVDAVAKSLQEFGFRQPIVVDADGVIIVGHTRWKAAVQLGLEEVPVHVATDMTPEQARAYRIADNQTSTLSEWDNDLLPAELRELRDEEFDLDLLGFDSEELSSLLDALDENEGDTDPDDVPKPADVHVTAPWVRGLRMKRVATPSARDSTYRPTPSPSANSEKVNVFTLRPSRHLQIATAEPTILDARSEG